jgi:hypothetical protein
VDDLAIQRLADRLDGTVRDTFLSIVSAIAASPQAAELNQLVENEDILGIIRLWERHLRASLTANVAQMEATLGNIVTKAAAQTIIVAGFSGTLTRISNTTLNWLRNESSRLIVGVSTESMLSIRQLLSAGYQAGTGVRPTARQIRAVVGILPSHAAAVTRYGLQLEALGFPQDKIDSYVETYTRRLLAYRADNIARTEAMTAAHVGQLEAWKHLVEQNLIDPRRSWMEWMTATDDRVCPLCAPMDGKRVRIGNPFISDTKGFPNGFPRNIPSPGADRLRKGPMKPDPFSMKRHRGRDRKGKNLDGFTIPLPTIKSVPHPPLHPSCRCTMRLVFDGTVS